MNQWYVIFSLIYNAQYRGYILSKLKKEYFSDDLSQNVFQYINDLFLSGKQIDESLIKSKFSNHINQIPFDITFNIDSYEEYISNLRQDYINNEISYFGKKIVNSKDINEEKLLTNINELINNIYSTKSIPVRSADVILDNVINDLMSDKKINNKIYGIEELDKHMDGLHNGDLILVAGRPSMGKSALTGWIAMKNALNKNVVAYFSLEMKPEKIMLRMLAGIANINLYKMKQFKSMSDKDRLPILQYVNKLKESKLFINQSSGLKLNELKSILQQIKMKEGKIDIIIIDYLQLMEGEGINDNTKVNFLSKGLKQIAMEYDCPVIVASQLSRSCEGRDNKRPILSDLRDSGGLEQDADIVIMLYRDYYYNRNPEHNELLELLVRKFRDGETGKIIIRYELQKQRMSSIKIHSKLAEISKQFKYE